MLYENAGQVVVTVGSGRGAIIRGPSIKLIVTAAHCLPRIPRSSLSTSFTRLLGRLDGEPSIGADCLFVDPIADIAILGPDEPDSYFEFIEPLSCLEISRAKEGTHARLLSLKNKWFKCVVRNSAGPLWLERAELPILDGMSGSPILSEDGRAFGLVNGSGTAKNSTAGGGHPQLVECLPGWLLRGMI